MSQVKLSQEQRVRRWLEQFAEGAAESAAFCVSRSVELLYGRPLDADGKPVTGAFESDRGLVEFALSFANGDADRSDMRRYLDAGDRKQEFAAGWAENPAYRLLAKESGRRPPRSATALRLMDKELLERRRGWLREMLAAVLTDKAQATERYRVPARRHQKEMHTVSRLRDSDGDIQHLVVIENSASLIAYVTLLLLGPLGSDLRRCTLEGCTRFFLVKKPKTGRPQELYCTRAHMLAAHGKKSTARSAKSRAKHKAARRPK